MEMLTFEHLTSEVYVNTSQDEDVQISIALATYNGEKYLREQLSSYTQQTFQPAELMITDDSRSPGTEKIIREFAASAPFPVQYFRNDTRLGFRDNFLRAASLCKSRYVAYSDQDDVWLPTKLAKCAVALKAEDTVMAIHGAYITDEVLNIKGRLNQGFKKDAVRRPLSIQPLPGLGFGFTMVFERRLLELVDKAKRPSCPTGSSGRGEPATSKRVLPHDLWTYFLASVFGNIAHIAEPLALYRQHGQNVFGSEQLPLRHALKRCLHIPLHQYKDRQQFSLAYSQLLSDVADELEPRARERAQIGSEFYGQVERDMRKRIDLYECRTVARRTSLYQNLWHSGAYRTTLGRASALRDLVNGVLSLRSTT